MDSLDDTAVILVDGDGSQFGGLSTEFEKFLHRSGEGRALHRIADAPFFVDSRITAGIQIADMVAGTIRIYEENDLYRRGPAGDAYLSAIERYYRVCREKTKDQASEDGSPRYGFYSMPEADHYPRRPTAAGEEAGLLEVENQ